MFFLDRQIRSMRLLGCFLNLIKLSCADIRGLCDFENAYWPLCFWTNLDGDLLGASLAATALWTRRVGPAPWTDTGPTADHTTDTPQGAYLYLHVDGNVTRRTEFAARLYGSNMPRTISGPLCFHMWYHAYGRDIVALGVYLVAKDLVVTELWRTSGQTDQRWRAMSVTVTSPIQGYHLVIEGVSKGRRPRDYVSDQESYLRSAIAIDDTSITRGECQACPGGQFGSQCQGQCGTCGANASCASDGQCEVCQPGYTQPRCTECTDTAYAYQGGCRPCGKCLLGAPCNNTTGVCLSCSKPFYSPECKNGTKCDRGYNGVRCDEQCGHGRYGYQCRGRCGQCADNSTCALDTGHCLTCDSGYVFPFCTDRCPEGRYGRGCLQRCGQCDFGQVCDHATGHCPSCRPGKRPPLCKQDCSAGRYGANCILKCGACADGTTCDKVTGQCQQGCKPSYKAPLCQTECPRGYYDDCQAQCGRCKGGLPCDKRTGHCAACAPDFSLPFCIVRCGDGKSKCNQSWETSTVIPGPASVVSPDGLAFYLGLAALAVGALCVAVFIGVCYKRGKASKSQSLPQDAKSALPEPEFPALPPEPFPFVVVTETTNAEPWSVGELATDSSDVDTLTTSSRKLSTPSQTLDTSRVTDDE